VKLPPFQTLVDEHRSDLYRFCVVTAGSGDADDVFQEAWIAALRAYPKLERADNLRAWLFRIAQNKTIDLQRARARRPVPVERPPEPATTDPPGPEDGQPELWAAVRALPPKQRAAVFCHTVLGMPYAELAELLYSTEEAARRNVFEGLNKLREEWTA
jgi:RNA polymerase sigma factor (sigma-70 family)